MHSLQQIVRHNDDAILAFTKDREQAHLLNAPRDENFDFNIPYHVEDGVLHAHVHRNTKVNDIIDLRDFVKAPILSLHEYE